MDINMSFIIIAVIIAGFTLYGLKKGLVHIVVGLLGIAVALIGAMILTGPVSTFVDENTGLHATIKQEMVGYIQKQIDQAKDIASKNTQKSVEKLQMDDIKKVLDQFTIPEEVKKTITETKASVSEIGTETAEIAAEKMTVSVIKGIVFIVLFIVLMIAITVLKVALNITAKLPLINKVNKLAGGIAGFAEGILVVWVLFTIVMAMSSQGWAQDILGQIGTNKLLLWLYSVNPIILLL